MAVAAAHDSLIGTALADKYRIVRQIGKGGMGIVYLGEHIELNKRVAIKMMLEKYADDSEAIARFKREALAASRIGNTHIIDIMDIGIAADGRSFVVMELLEGSSLGDVIKASGPMPAWRAVHIMRQTLRAVSAAHAKGIIHRDLKPDNIFLVNQDDHHDFVKLLDFGISKMVDQAAEIASTRLTTTGMVMGTPLYMAPEQAMGAVTDGLADMYALGVILYEMLAGKPPLDGNTYAVLIAKLLTVDPPLLSEVRPGLPANLVAATHRALEKEPQNRFANCEAFAAALPNLDRTSSSIELAQTLDSDRIAAVAMPMTPGRAVSLPTPPGQPASGKGSKLPLIIGALGTGLAVGTVAILLSMRGGDAKPRPLVSEIVDPSKAASLDAGLAPTEVGTLHVKSVPSGGTAKLDGNIIGTTPVTITVAAGVHRVRVELGGTGIEQEVEIRAGRDSDTLLGLPTVVGSGSGSGGGAGSGSAAKIIKPKVPLLVKPQALPHVEPTPPPGAGPVEPTGFTAPRDLTVARPEPTKPEPPKPPKPKPEPKPEAKPQDPTDGSSKPIRRSNPYQ
ncbi:MAG: serine/threonine protein kinase [Proteobacteria bacterium]|nr:serine/threonine protein kinase [Pseudomonadota bacterium]